MAWDASQPADNTKIRNLGTVIRANNEAVSTGDSTFKPEALNLSNRTPLGSSNDPSAVSNAYVLYCKEDTNSNAELFGIDDAGNISQLTARASTIASPGYATIAPGLLMQWGNVSIPGNGNTTVTFPVAFSSTVLNAQTSFGTGGSRVDGIVVDTFTATTMRIVVSSIGSGSKTVYWTAIGPA